MVTLKELSKDERIRMECQAREDLRRDFASATELEYGKAVQDGLAKDLKLTEEYVESIISKANI